MAMNYPPGNLAVLGGVPSMGNKFHTGGQTGPQGATPIVTEPYQATICLRFESGRR